MSVHENLAALRKMKGWRAFFGTDCCQGDRCQQRRWSIGIVGESGISINGRWYCSPRCFEVAAVQELHRIVVVTEMHLGRTNRIPLALLMVSRGFISQEQLRKALQEQRGQGRGKIGYWLQEIAGVTEQQIASCLAMQSGCALFPVPRERTAGPGIPWAIAERFRVVPVFYSAPKRILYLGFNGPVDHLLTLSVERATRVKTEPCMITDSEMQAGLSYPDGSEEKRESILEQNSTAAEMAKIVRSYAIQLHCHAIDVVNCRGTIWARLSTRQGPYDIMFGKPAHSRTDSDMAKWASSS